MLVEIQRHVPLRAAIRDKVDPELFAFRRRKSGGQPVAAPSETSQVKLQR